MSEKAKRPRGNEDSSRSHLIATNELSARDLPGPKARREEIEPFCLTFDGYAENHEVEDCLAIEDRLRNGDLGLPSTDELRIALFIRQRAMRWNAATKVPAADIRFVRKVMEGLPRWLIP